MASRSNAISLIFLTFLCTGVAVADPPSTQSSTQSSKAWDLPGLSGTALQIKLQLHQELDDLNEKIAAAEGDVRAAQAEMEKHRQVVAVELANGNDATFQYVCKTIADSLRDLSATQNQARADQLRIKIAGFTKRKEAMIDLAVAHNADTPRFLSEISRKTSDVNRLKNDLSKCIDWRCELGAAVRGGLSLQWPVKIGALGILGPIKITSIDASGLVAAEGHLFVPVSQDAKQTEGIITVHGHSTPATFLISGWNDRAISVGATTFMDQMVRVISTAGDEDGAVVRVERSPSDEGAILDDFREFRKSSEGDLAR